MKLERFKKWITCYLSMCLVIGAYETADTVVRLSGTISFTAMSFTAPAYADGNREPATPHWPVLRPSKPVMWVNYSDPRPKGKDEDKGAKPSYYPVCSVNNVSMLPAISHTLFNVKTPIGSFDISPTLSYSPPTVSRNIDWSGRATLSVSATPTAFGHCWTWNLSPCIERTASKVDELYTSYREDTLSFSDGPAPSALFHDSRGSQPMYENTDFSADDWVQEPLTKGEVASPGIVFWGSGIKVDESSGPSEFREYPQNKIHTSYTRYNWPGNMYDRNHNEIHFDYDSVVQNVVGYWSDFEPDSTPVYPILSVSQPRTGRRLTVKSEPDSNGVRVTNVTECLDDLSLRAASFEYTTKTLVSRTGRQCHTISINLLSKVTLPDRSEITYQYIEVEAISLEWDDEGGNHTLQVFMPLISSITTPNDTISISYGNFGWYGSYENERYQPGYVTISSDYRGGMWHNNQSFYNTGFNARAVFCG